MNQTVMACRPPQAVGVENHCLREPQPLQAPQKRGAYISALSHPSEQRVIELFPPHFLVLTFRCMNAPVRTTVGDWPRKRPALLDPEGRIYHLAGES